MNPSLVLDLVLTVSLSAALGGGGAVALWLLPWTDAEREGTLRGAATVARRAVDGASALPAWALAQR